MAGVTYTIDTEEVERVLGRLQQWTTEVNLASLNRAIAAEVESQSRRRIEDERTAPDGTSWAQWSDGYTATRHSNHRLLQNEGDLLESLTALAGAQRAEVGTNLVYAAPHQFVSEPLGIPARPFLGVSEDNADDLLGVVEHWVNLELGRLSRGL